MKIPRKQRNYNKLCLKISDFILGESRSHLFLEETALNSEAEGFAGDTAEENSGIRDHEEKKRRKKRRTVFARIVHFVFDHLPSLFIIVFLVGLFVCCQFCGLLLLRICCGLQLSVRSVAEGKPDIEKDSLVDERADMNM